MKKVYVIGATGHIGSYLCPALIENGYSVKGYYRGITPPYSVFNKKYQECLEIGDRNIAIENAIASEADIICDLIPYSVSDVETLCKRVVDCGNKIKIISIGSIWAYGEKSGRYYPLTEKDEKRATDEYGRKKAEIEKYLLNQHRMNGLKVTVLHPGHICGIGWLPVGPLGNRNKQVIENIKNGQKVFLPDRGNATLQHVHAKDVSRMIINAIEFDSADGQAFNIVCESPITLREYTELLFYHYNQKVNIEYVSYEQFISMLNMEDAMISEEHILRSPNISMEKAKDILGYRPIYSERDTIFEAMDSVFEPVYGVWRI